MSDQADHLRTLVQAAAATDALTTPPPIIAVVGGRRGVGVTTAAIQLAVALRRMDFRVALIDADLENPTVANLCQVTGESALTEVLAGRRTVQETLVQGPVGIQILPGAKSHSDPYMTVASQDRLLAGLKRMGSTTDIIVLDLGSGMRPGNPQLGQLSDLILLVTTTEPDAVMDAYAAIKCLNQGIHEPALATPAANTNRAPTSRNPKKSSSAALPPIATLVRDTNDPAMALNVHHRLASACQRFLGIELRSAPSFYLPHAGRSAAHTANAFRSPAPSTVNSHHCLAQFVAIFVGLIDPSPYRAAG